MDAEFEISASSGIGSAKLNFGNLKLYHKRYMSLFYRFMMLLSKLIACRCRDDDLFVVLSTVAYQNLDPIVLGKTPADCGLSDITDL